MKILMASSFFASHNGGLERVAGELFRAFTDRGREIVWMAGDITPPPESAGRSRAVPLRIFDFVEDKIGVPFPIPAPSALAQIIREIRASDVLILHDCLYLSNIFAFLAARWRRIPIVIVQHIGLIPYRNFALHFIMRFANSIATRRMLSSAEQVIFISEITRRYFGDLRFKRAPELIFNGVNTGLYRPRRGAEKSDIRRKYGLPTDCHVILFVGRFVEKKGLPILKLMVSQRPGFVWAFAGMGPLDPKDWNAPNVRVFPWMNNENLAELYRACDIFALPSKGEGFPLVIQEALASGLPVVCGSETSLADCGLAPLVHGTPIHADDDRRTAEEFLLSIDNVIRSQRSELTPEQVSAFAATRYSLNTAVDRYLSAIGRLVPEHVFQTQGAEINPRIAGWRGMEDHKGNAGR